MQNRCKECESQYWKLLYVTSVQRFDKVQARMILIFILLSVLTAVCCFITALACIRTHRFIAEYECVEETQVEIEQDSEGENLAVIGNESEVNVWDKLKNSGEKSQRQEK